MARETVEDVEDIVLPADLEERTNAQFDDMVSKGRIFYDQQTEPGEVFVDDEFLVSVCTCFTATLPEQMSPGEFYVCQY
jgi:hypothetical protein